ncbi:PAS domain S-box protein [bacterium]|nr:PAS domain S-box protein [bacterium]
MKDQNKSKNQLIQEVQDLRNQVARFKKTEEKHKNLKESEQKYRKLADNAADILIQMNLDGTINYMSKSVEKEMGYTREEVEGENISKFLTPQSLKEAFDRIQKWTQGTKNLPPYEIEAKAKDGRRITFELNTSPIYKGNQLKAVDIVARNVNARKQAEEEMRKSEERLRTLIETIPESIYFKDREGRNVLVNKAYEELVGKKKEDILGKKDPELFPPELAQQCIWSDEEALKKKKPVHSQEKITAKNGEKIYFDTSKSPLLDKNGNIQGIVGVSRDVSERMRAQEALKEREKRLRDLFDGLPVGIYRSTPKGDSINGNLALMRLLNFPDRETMLNTNTRDTYVNPEERKKWQGQMEKNDYVMGFETQWRRYDGKVIWVRESARTVRDEEGTVLYYEGVAEDISEQKKAEKALEKQRAYFDQLFEGAPEAISVTNSKGKVLRVNEEFTHLFGFSKQEANGRYIDDLIAPHQYHDEAVDITRRVAKGEKGFYETQRRHKNGSLIDISLLVSPVMVKGKQVAVYGIYRDITEQKQAEKTIQDSLKEKDVMLREIHHRVKNNLQIIISLLRLQSDQVKNKDDLAMFKESQDRIRSMALIHEKLYQSEDLAQVDFSRYIQNFASYLFHTYRVDPNSIRLHTDIEKFSIDINTAIPLGLIINELLSNSLKHAFPEGGEGDIYVKLQSYKRARKLTIQDNGVGLPENVDLKGRDTLGMQLITSLVKQIKGIMEVKRKKGTTFIIDF